MFFLNFHKHLNMCVAFHHTTELQRTIPAFRQAQGCYNKGCCQVHSRDTSLVAIQDHLITKPPSPHTHPKITKW